MRPAPHDSSGKPSSSAPAAGPAPTTPSAPSAPASTAPTPINELGASSPDLLQVPRTVAYSSYPLPEVENIAGFVMPGLPHGQIFGPYPMLHSDPPRRFSESARARGQAATPESDHRTPNPLPRPSRTSEEDHENAYEWSYDAIWDQNQSIRGKGRERDRDRTYDRK